MMRPMEEIGAIPQDGVNPKAQSGPRDPREEFGLTDEDLEALRRDPEIIEMVRQVTGRDFPMQQIDDHLLAILAGMVHKLGVEGAVAEANRLLPPEQKATIRGIAMKDRIPRLGGQL